MDIRRLATRLRATNGHEDVADAMRLAADHVDGCAGTTSVRKAKHMMAGPRSGAEGRAYIATMTLLNVAARASDIDPYEFLDGERP